MAYDLKSILNTFLSKEEVMELCRKLSLPVSLRKGDLVESIILYGDSTDGIGRILFRNIVRSSLEKYWDDCYVETVRLNLHIPESSTKAEILDEIFVYLTI